MQEFGGAFFYSHETVLTLYYSLQKTAKSFLVLVHFVAIFVWLLFLDFRDTP